MYISPILIGSLAFAGTAIAGKSCKRKTSTITTGLPMSYNSSLTSFTSQTIDSSSSSTGYVNSTTLTTRSDTTSASSTTVTPPYSHSAWTSESSSIPTSSTTSSTNTTSIVTSHSSKDSPTSRSNTWPGYSQNTTASTTFVQSTSIRSNVSSSYGKPSWSTSYMWSQSTSRPSMTRPTYSWGSISYSHPGSSPVSSPTSSRSSSTTSQAQPSSSSGYIIPAIIPVGTTYDLKPQLSQRDTNGGSVLGTLDAPTLDMFRRDGTILNGSTPWGPASPTTGWYDEDNIPNTGTTRYYSFSVGRQTLAPDGVATNLILVNGQYPGPTIEANWGDYIEVTVTNELITEGTSLHWHGLLQKETPWFDGTPGISQCPIAPGSSYTYRFRADKYGSSWYHSHYSAQYTSGCHGAMIIHGPSSVSYDIDIGPVLLSDWYHEDYATIIGKIKSGTGRSATQSNSNLINGKMNYPCTKYTGGKPCTNAAGLSKFRFQSGKKHLIRLINSGSDGTQKFAIDGHQMTVIANDFVQVVPYKVDVVTLGIGQRTDIIVEAIGSPDDVYWMRSSIATCADTDGINRNAVAAIYYEHVTDTNSMPNTTSPITQSALDRCSNDDLSLTTPYLAIEPETGNAVKSQNAVISFQPQNVAWTVNNQAFKANFSAPLLYTAQNDPSTFSAQSNIYDFGNASSIRVILYNQSPVAHPMHMHGHDFLILAQGTGTWDGSIFRQSNPQRRDVQLMPPGGSYLVMQFKADNPGLWPLHCHLAWHSSQGLFINILERPDDIDMATVSTYRSGTCASWDAWAGVNVGTEPASGN